MDMLRLLSSAGNQTHFKLVVCDNETGEVGAFVDFENVFAFDEFAGNLVKLVGHEPTGDFAAAADHVMKTMSAEDLLALTQVAADGESGSVSNACSTERNRKSPT